ncbi:Prolyl-tRNA synthetase associated domain-containing protein, partial [Dysosmobacter welbionis]
AGRSGAGPVRIDPGHLRPAGQDQGRAAPGGAGPVPVSAAPADRHVDPSGATGGHQRQGAHRLQGPRRNPAGDGPPPHPPEDRQAPGGPGGGPPGALHPAAAAAEERNPGGGHCGLYQRGQVHAAEPPDRSGHPRQQPAVRHAGHHQPPSHGQRHAGRGDLRHG